MIPRPTLHPPVSLVAALIAPLIAGCASIAKGPYAPVEVIAPPEVTITTMSGASIPSTTVRDSVRVLSLSTDSTQYVVLNDDTLRRAYVLEPQFDLQWVLLDIFTPGSIISVIVDATTGSWFDFGDVAIVYRRDSAGGHSELAPLDSIMEARRRTPIGLIVVAVIGSASPTSQTVLLPNHYMLGLGYQITDRFSAFATLNGQACIDLGDYVGTTGHRPSIFCNVSSIELGVDMRVRVFKGLYVGGGVGRTSVQSSDSVMQDYRRVAPGVRVTIPYASAAIGYAGHVGVIELRRSIGLERIPIGGDVTGVLDLWTLHYGFNLVF